MPGVREEPSTPVLSQASATSAVPVAWEGSAVAAELAGTTVEPEARARSSREAGGVTIVSIKTEDHHGLIERRGGRPKIRPKGQTAGYFINVTYITELTERVMAEPMRISATHFSKEVGRYSDLALTQPVMITRNGRDRTVMISAEEYGRLQRHATTGPAEREPASGTAAGLIDARTRAAAAAFLARIEQSHAPVGALLYGSRARGTHKPDSDADIAVILKGEPENRYQVAGPLADAAYDVLMETGIYIQPLPLWETKLKRPELFSNPALIETIKREGIRL